MGNETRSRWCSTLSTNVYCNINAWWVSFNDRSDRITAARHGNEVICRPSHEGVFITLHNIPSIPIARGYDDGEHNTEQVRWWPH